MANTQDSLSWLPDHQLGVAATLSHADQVIELIGGLLFDYQRQPGGVFELEVRHGEHRTQAVLARISPIPKKIALLVADALVALRASLEHALFAEVEFRDGALKELAARQVEIPAVRSAEDFHKWTTKRLNDRPASLRPGSELVDRIEHLQPYNRKDAQNHPLSRLVRYTNHAKHRTPAITAVRMAAAFREDQHPRSVREVRELPDVPMRIGDVLAEVPFGSPVSYVFAPTLGINLPGTDRWPILMKELGDISHWVRTQAVPHLITGANSQELALPAQYEIDKGHDDEREAIALGSQVPASERFSQRMGAAVVRRNLIEILSQVEGFPSPDRITTWLEQLSDLAVLEQFSKLHESSSSGSGTAAILAKRFETMRENLLAFEMRTH